MPVNKPLDPRFEKEVLYLAKTMNGCEIARRLNTNPDRVWYVLKKNKTKPFKSHYRPISEVLAIVRHAVKHGQSSAARKYGITVRQVKQAKLRYKKLDQEIIKRAPAVRDSAIAYGINTGNMNPQTAEEFGSYCMERYLTEMGNVFFNTAVVDFYRIRLGRNGNKNQDIGVESLDEFSGPEQEDNVLNLIPKTHEGLLTRLVYKYGFTMSEIGSMLDITEGRVCQIVRGVVNDIRRTVETD